MSQPPYQMEFDPGTIKHLGLQMYSTLPPVIGELISNAWDADATRVDIVIPTNPVTDASEITVEDDGFGMSDKVANTFSILGLNELLQIGKDKVQAKQIVNEL